MLVRAKYLIPIDRRPIKNGAIRVERGVITELGTARQLADHGAGPVIDLGDAALLPGFINAHTHLELSHLARTVPPRGDFFGWLERLRAATSGHANADQTFADAARDGMMRSLAAGVTTVGDITARPATVRPVIRHGPLRVVSFGEVIATGVVRDRLAVRLQAAVNARHASDHLAIGVSPHSPYTIESDGMRACVEVSGRLHLRLCMHLGETPDEARYTEYGDGPVRDFLRRAGVWDDVISCPRMRPVPLAHSCGVLNDRTVLAHCNDVTDGDIDLLRASGAHVAYCPRTHHAFGHAPHRFREMLAAGVNVCLGTDSLASNPSLSVLDELRFLRSRHRDLDGPSLLEMATVRGARALGVFGVGSLVPGHRADLTAVPLDADHSRDTIENILASNRQPVATFINGRRITSKSTPT